jgi:aminopeptidase-like protein
MDALEQERVYLSRQPRGEPQLGRRGLYPATGGAAPAAEQLALLWTLNLADGRHSLLDMAERSGLPVAALQRAADALVGAGLLDEVGAAAGAGA